MKRIFLLLTICGLHWSVWAQNPNASGKKLYKRMGYKSSIPKLQNDTKMDLAVMRKIADSYRLNHDTQNAELWYAQVVEESKMPLDYLYYAQALQSNGKTDRAKQYYIIYDDMMGGDAKDRRGELLAAAVDRMNEFEHSNVHIENVQLLNSNKLDFSPAYYNDGIVFVSTRPAPSEANPLRDIWIDDNFMALFIAKQNTNGTLANPMEFSEKITTKYHEGPVSFTRNGDQIFFTRNHYNKGKRKNNSKGVMKLQIYTATRSGDSWTDARELPFNTTEYEEAHPSISPDGTQLYFASDREGGFGGMDLYVSRFENGTWSEPTNLGENVNTAGNEIFPFIHDDGSLYFASNGWGGIGGLDLFRTSLASGDSLWNKANNLGIPFNSPKDDFGLVTNVLGTEGYFTSAREGGSGKDDIYHFVRDLAPQTLHTNLFAFRTDTNAPLEGVTIEIEEVKSEYNCDTVPNDLALRLEKVEGSEDYLIKLNQRVVCNAPNENVVTTNANGEANMPLFPDKEYVAIAKKGGYEVARYPFSTADKKGGVDEMDVRIGLQKLDCTNLYGMVTNKKYTTPIPYATVTLINMCTGEELALQTGENGQFRFPCIACGCDFKLKGSKVNFWSDTKDVSTLTGACIEGTDTQVLLALLPNEDAMLADGSNGYGHNQPNAYNTMTMALNGNSKNLHEGAIIELKNIFYDFDKYYIRAGAAVELDLVAELMHKYPGMIIELSSHTDARGSERYNEWLSRKRAEKAVDYIVSKGIDTRRLIAHGYGENQLRNQCTNYVECSEIEHQYNRRTEIRIIKFDRNADVDVKYIDNVPEKIDAANPKRKFIWK